MRPSDLDRLSEFMKKYKDRIKVLNGEASGFQIGNPHILQDEELDGIEKVLDDIKEMLIGGGGWWRNAMNSKRSWKKRIGIKYICIFMLHWLILFTGCGRNNKFIGGGETLFSFWRNQGFLW